MDLGEIPCSSRRRNNHCHGNGHSFAPVITDKDLLGRYAIVSAKLVSHFVEEFLGRHNPPKEHIDRLERSLVHSIVKRGVAITRESHLIVPEESRSRRGFAAHIRCRAHDDYGLDAVIAQNGVEVRLKECVILMLYDAVLTLFWGKHLVIKLEKHLFSWLGSGAKFQRYVAVRRH
jgi:hypothetical protein